MGVFLPYVSRPFRVISAVGTDEAVDSVDARSRVRLSPRSYQVLPYTCVR
jgi:hypothetical protein